MCDYHPNFEEDYHSFSLSDEEVEKEEKEEKKVDEEEKKEEKQEEKKEPDHYYDPNAKGENDNEKKAIEVLDSVLKPFNSIEQDFIIQCLCKAANGNYKNLIYCSQLMVDNNFKKKCTMQFLITVITALVIRSGVKREHNTIVALAGLWSNIIKSTQPSNKKKCFEFLFDTDN